MTDTGKILSDMNDRSREVFRRVVEAYLDSGDPVATRSPRPAAFTVDARLSTNNTSPTIKLGSIEPEVM